jgi:hypothetical protein
MHGILEKNQNQSQHCEHRQLRLGRKLGIIHLGKYEQAEKHGSHAKKIPPEYLAH